MSIDPEIRRLVVSQLYTNYVLRASFFSQTEVFLTISGHMYGRPIHGQLEVKGEGATGYNTLWKSAEGVFIKPTEAPKTIQMPRDEF